jgi:uncharacterized protein YqiB (DUF1249 family)
MSKPCQTGPCDPEECQLDCTMKEQRDAEIMRALRAIFREPKEYVDGTTEDYQINGGDLVDWLDWVLKKPHAMPYEMAVGTGLINEPED